MSTFEPGSYLLPDADSPQSLLARPHAQRCSQSPECSEIFRAAAKKHCTALWLFIPQEVLPNRIETVDDGFPTIA